jgi:tRNA (guanine10-N2)-dimethyltransferase
MVYGDPSGGRLDIAEAELEALLESDGQKVKAVPQGCIVTCQAKMLPSWMAARAAFLRDVGALLWAGGAGGLVEQAAELDYSALAGRTFKVDAEGFGESEKRSVDQLYGEKILSSVEGSAVSMKRPEAVLRVVREGRDGFVGLTTPREGGKWVERRPRARPYFHPSALFPKLARLMVNLAAVPPGGTFLDPFSGTCSTVIEACMVGAYSVGVDLDKKMIFGGRRNLRWFGFDEGSQVLHADARFLPFREVDAIAGDVPYGRASSTRGSASGDLLCLMLTQASECLRARGRLAVMHQKGSSVHEPKGFELLGEYGFYVHRSLTRVISVLRKS